MKRDIATVLVQAVGLVRGRLTTTVDRQPRDVPAVGWPEIRGLSFVVQNKLARKTASRLHR